MTVFRVGMRVRVVRDLGNTPHLVGFEGVISSFRRGFAPPNESFTIRLKGLAFVAFSPDELEPILDQHQPCESEFKESLDRMLEGVSA